MDHDCDFMTALIESTTAERDSSPPIGQTTILDCMFVVCFARLPCTAACCLVDRKRRTTMGRSPEAASPDKGSFLHDVLKPLTSLILGHFFLAIRSFFNFCLITRFMFGAVRDDGFSLWFARTVEPGASESEGDDGQSSSGLRRACSLSDLSKPSPRRLLPSPPNNGIFLF